MSFFGKNIRKIRSLKSLSQQDFGELFDLKRATLGAYEEERSEPKIDTIIKIANYFSIPIGDLLTRELTVNQIAKFKSELTFSPDTIKSDEFSPVYCIRESNLVDYAANFDNDNYISRLPQLFLPVNPEKTFRALTVANLEMSKHDKGFYPRDIVIGEKVPKSVYSKLTNGTLVFIVSNGEVIFRRLYILKREYILRADHKGIEDKHIKVKDIQEMWRVRYVFFSRIPEFGVEVDNKIDYLEQQIREIRDLNEKR